MWRVHLKTRTDFVSNSSSCSFILSKADNAVDLGFRTFAKTFPDDYIPYDFTDKVRIGIKVKNKNFKKLYETLKDEKPNFQEWYEDWQTGKRTPKDPEEVGWDSIEIDFDAITRSVSEYPDVIDMIEEVSFTTEDHDTAGTLYLKLLYLFFDRNACFPDATNTEHSFMDLSNANTFIGKLCSATQTN